MKVVRYVQSTIKGILLNFSYILRKSIATAFVKQNIQILYWVPVIFVVTYFSVAVVKNGRGLSDHRTLKSAASQERELIKRTDFFPCWYKFRKANVNLVIFGWAWSKMGNYTV